VAPLRKGRGGRAKTNPNNAQGGLDLPVKIFYAMSRLAALGKTRKVPAFSEKSRRFVLLAEP